MKGKRKIKNKMKRNEIPQLWGIDFD
jgi:hypothetical protein